MRLSCSTSLCYLKNLVEGKECGLGSQVDLGSGPRVLLPGLWTCNVEMLMPPTPLGLFEGIEISKKGPGIRRHLSCHLLLSCHSCGQYRQRGRCGQSVPSPLAGALCLMSCLVSVSWRAQPWAQLLVTSPGRDAQEP